MELKESWSEWRSQRKVILSENKPIAYDTSIEIYLNSAQTSDQNHM
jgi:hypothetical protein